jgi:hypothetical protein
VSKVDSLYIDSDIFITDDGHIVRFVDGRAEGWETDELPDSLLREQPHYSLLASASDKRTGNIYAYDKSNNRIVAIDKAKGTYVEQYRLAGNAPGWEDVRGMYVVLAGEGVPPTLVWANNDGLYSSILEAVPDTAPATPGTILVRVAGTRLGLALRLAAGCLRRAVIPLRDANPVRRTPIITIATIVACVVVFAYTLGIEASQGAAGAETFFETWGVVPANLVAAWKAGDYVSHETLTVFTSMFLHVNLIHLAGNMIYLWIFGNNIEDKLGRLWFVGFYFVGGSPRSSPRSSSTRRRGADGRRIGRDLGGPRCLPRAVPGRPDPVTRLPRASSTS